MKLRLSEEGEVTLRRFAFEISTIICGVVIALGVDGLADWRHERHLVREAEENLRAELRDNREQLRQMLAGVPTHRTEIENALRLATTALTLVEQRGAEAAGKAMETEHFVLNLGGVALSDSSRTTAEQTGAFSHMRYDEVKKYAAVYFLQRRFQQMNDDLYAQFRLSLPLDRGKLTDMRVADLDRWRQSLRTLLQHLYLTEQLGRQLLAVYDRRL